MKVHSGLSGRVARAGGGGCAGGVVAGEGGFVGAVLQEALHSGALVGGAEQGGELDALDFQAGGQVYAQAVVDGLLGGAQGEGGAGGVAADQVQGRLVDGLVRRNQVDQADGVRLVGVDHPAGEHDVLGLGRADQAGQP